MGTIGVGDAKMSADMNAKMNVKMNVNEYE